MKIPTAPRKPTHEMNSFSRRLKRNGARQRNTAAGRATSISAAATASAGKIVSGRRSGHDSRPSSDEHRDLREPGGGVEECDDRVVGAGRRCCRPPARRCRRRESPSRARSAASAKMTSAPVATNGACRPCGSSSRLSTNTIGAAAGIADEAAEEVSRASSSAISDHALLPTSRISTSTMVRKIANGSLMPDSTSSVALTRGRSRSPRACSRKNTAAASVEATTAPISSDSVQPSPSAAHGGRRRERGGHQHPHRGQHAGGPDHVAEGLQSACAARRRTE